MTDQSTFKVRVDKHGIKGAVFWRLGSWWLRFTDRTTKKMHRVTLHTSEAKIAKQKAISYLTISG